MRFLPLALLLAAAPFASGFTCNINIDEDDDDGCADVEELCPNLACEAGFATDEDGCALCECAAPISDGGTAPDDGGTGVTTCMDDSECSDGQHCDTVNFCESACGEARPGEPQDCPAVCLGRCVDGPPPPSECFSDFDCGPNQICVFDGGTEPAPACDPDQQDCDSAGLVAPSGRCVDVEPPQDECFSDADCPADQLCAFNGGGAPACDPATGNCDDGSSDLIAQSGVCIDRDPPTSCFSDFDCQPGEVCSFDSAGGGGSGAAPCAPDTNCDPMPPPQPEGVCIAAEPVDAGPPQDGGAAPGCFSDEDCPNGFCQLEATCAGLDCPPPPPSQCVFPSCDDDSQAVCDMMTPLCPAGQTAAIRGGCYECVDARTCEEPPQPTCDDPGADCG